MNGYKDPSKEILSNGMSVAATVRGNKDMKGVIISPAGVDGRSLGFNPHDKSSIAINIESDSGNGQTLSLSQFTREAVSAAIKTAGEKITGNDIDSIRERAAVAFEELSKISTAGVVKKAAAAPPVVSPSPAASFGGSGNPPSVNTSTGDTDAEDSGSEPQVDRSYSPMAAFGLKKSRSPATSTATVARPAKEVGPPTKLLYFEKEGIGTVPAFFHDVVTDVNFDEEIMAETGFIVLVYDLRYEQATARWFPPASDPYRRPWALQINNDRRLYLVQTTGFQYVYDNREFCILSVEKAVTADI